MSRRATSGATCAKRLKDLATSRYPQAAALYVFLFHLLGFREEQLLAFDITVEMPSQDSAPGSWWWATGPNEVRFCASMAHPVEEITGELKQRGSGEWYVASYGRTG